MADRKIRSANRLVLAREQLALEAAAVHPVRQVVRARPELNGFVVCAVVVTSIVMRIGADELIGDHKCRGQSGREEKVAHSVPPWSRSCVRKGKVRRGR